MKAILIDDEAVAVSALKRRVDWEKYGIDQVFVANSMEQAKQVFQENDIQVMLSDIEMPNGSGLELLEWVKTYYPAVECVYVTCHPEFEYMRKAMQLGSADYLLKPIDYDELDQILERLVERMKSRHQRELIPPQVMQHFLEEGRDSFNNDVVRNVMEYIREHIQDRLSIPGIAKEFYLSEQQLIRIFKKITGTSVLEYITNERLRLARELLAGSDYPVHQVADAVGYGNYSYFIKVFRTNTGMTPKEYRRDRRQGTRPK